MKLTRKVLWMTYWQDSLINVELFVEVKPQVGECIIKGFQFPRAYFVTVAQLLPRRLHLCFICTIRRKQTCCSEVCSQQRVEGSFHRYAVLYTLQRESKHRTKRQLKIGPKGQERRRGWQITKKETSLCTLIKVKLHMWIFSVNNKFSFREENSSFDLRCN